MVKTPNLHRTWFSALVSVLIIIEVISAVSVSAPFAGASKTIIVPDDYATISVAVKNASPGDTILVKAGEYHENPVVDKQLSILSQDPNGAAVVVGEGGLERGAKPIFTLAADGVTLSGFTIQSSNYSNTTLYASGVKIAGDSCVLSGNNIVGTYYGVFCSVQSFTTITHNNITDTLKDSIRICGGSQNTISDNLITGNAQSGVAIDGYSDTITGNDIHGNNRGIGLGASYSVVFGNNLSGNSESGMYIASSDSFIVANNITQNGWGVYFTSYFAAPNNNTFYNNNFEGNSQPVGTASTYNGQIWDNGVQGNFWSSNNASAGTPFAPYEGNADNHPLVAPYVLPSGTMSPALPDTPKAPDGTVGMWHFDEVSPNGVTPDSADSNPVILEPSSDNTYTPLVVDGKEGKALRFNGTDYAYVTASPTLDIKEEVTIDAWVNVQEYKNVEYENIVVEAMRTPDKYPTRIMGFAINGVPPENAIAPPLGALRGFFLDDSGVFNEIVTTQAVVPLNQWVHVVFVRSLKDGMHIYVDNAEQQVKVTSGTQNPTGQIAKGTEFYIGHDSISTIDEVSISTTTKAPISLPLWAEWWFWTELAVGAFFLAGLAFFLKRSRTQTTA
jgi:parallel beta-helix repeat protein